MENEPKTCISSTNRAYSAVLMSCIAARAISRSFSNSCTGMSSLWSHLPSGEVVVGRQNAASCKLMSGCLGGQVANGHARRGRGRKELARTNARASENPSPKEGRGNGDGWEVISGGTALAAALGDRISFEIVGQRLDTLHARVGDIAARNLAEPRIRHVRGFANAAPFALSGVQLVRNELE